MVNIDSEKELEDYLLSILREIPNLTTTQQVKLGHYGVADIVSWTVSNLDGHMTLYYQVIEVKKGSAGLKALSQLCRYIKAIEMNLTNNRELYTPQVDEILVQGALVCGDVTERSDFGYILAQMQNVFVYKYNLNLERGLKTKRWSGWMRGITKDPFKSHPLLPVDQFISTAEIALEDDGVREVPNYSFLL